MSSRFFIADLLKGDCVAGSVWRHSRESQPFSTESCPFSWTIRDRSITFWSSRMFPGPRVLSQRLHRFGRNRFNFLAHALGELIDEVTHQQGNVFRAVAQGRNVNRKYVQAIVKVAAKLPLKNHLFQIAMSRSHNPNVYFFGPRTPQWLRIPALAEHAGVSVAAPAGYPQFHPETTNLDPLARAGLSSGR